MTSQLQEWLRKKENKYYKHWNLWQPHYSQTKLIESLWSGQKFEYYGMDWAKGYSKSEKVSYVPFFDELKYFNFDQTKYLLDKQKKEKSMFPTSGTRYEWKSKDGRLTKVSELSLPHLANILIQLYDSAAKAGGIDLDKVGEYSKKTIHNFLDNNCFTWQALKGRAEEVHFISSLDGFTLTPKCRGMVWNKRNVKNTSNQFILDEMKYYPSEPHHSYTYPIEVQLMSMHLSHAAANYLIKKILERVR